MPSIISCPYQLLLKSCPNRKTVVETISTDGWILLENNLKVQITRTIEAAADWSAIVENQTLFLQPKYLKAIETCPPKAMSFAYLTFYKNNQPCGVAYAQIFKFSTYESLKHHRSFKDEKAKFLKAKKWVARKIEFCSIVCGNVLMTGEYGYHFDNQLVEQSKQFEVVNQGLEQLQEKLRKEGVKAKVTLFKDYADTNRQNIENTKFKEFQIQPNMVIDLDENWKKFEDYLGAMSSKYRVRAKKAFKKAKEIEKRELDIEEVRYFEAKMFGLYQEIVVSAGFNGITLEQPYFTNLKEQLDDNFKVIGYFKEGELVGFYTVFFENNKDGDVIESHYLGISQADNRKYQIYINMLYDMVRMGIYHQKKRIYLARTALEIKSSVGAAPHDLYFYMKHNNLIFNSLTKRVFDLFNPQEEWTQRRPFK